MFGENLVDDGTQCEERTIVCIPQESSLTWEKLTDVAQRSTQNNGSDVWHGMLSSEVLMLLLQQPNLRRLLQHPTPPDR